MKYFYLFLLIPVFSFGQPNPQKGYPARIKAINERLEKEPFNYALIWERLTMKVNLLGGFATCDIGLLPVFTEEDRCAKTDCAAFEKEFKIIYDHVIATGNTDVAEEGDYYLNRMWFYTSTLQKGKAMADAVYLRDHASVSKFTGRGEYYHDWALNTIYYLHVLGNDYNNALEAINAILDRQRNREPQLYFSGNSKYTFKVQLYEHFDKQKELICYLKQVCREGLSWYLERKAMLAGFSDDQSILISENEFYTGKESFTYFIYSAKETAFFALQRMIEFLEKYEDPELPAVKELYELIRYKGKERYEAIDPLVSDKTLAEVLSGLNSLANCIEK